MKIRLGFVSNSSSSSFIISVHDLTQSQLINLLTADLDGWDIKNVSGKVVGMSSAHGMDEAAEYLRSIRLDLSKVAWEYR